MSLQVQAASLKVGVLGVVAAFICHAAMVCLVPRDLSRSSPGFLRIHWPQVFRVLLELVGDQKASYIWSLG